MGRGKLEQPSKRNPACKRQKYFDCISSSHTQKNPLKQRQCWETAETFPQFQVWPSPHVKLRWVNCAHDYAAVHRVNGTLGSCFPAKGLSPQDSCCHLVKFKCHWAHRPDDLPGHWYFHYTRRAVVVRATNIHQEVFATRCRFQGWAFSRSYKNESTIFLSARKILVRSSSDCSFKRSVRNWTICSFSLFPRFRISHQCSFEQRTTALQAIKCFLWQNELNILQGFCHFSCLCWSRASDLNTESVSRCSPKLTAAKRRLLNPNLKSHLCASGYSRIHTRQSQEAINLLASHWSVPNSWMKQCTGQVHDIFRG